MQSNTSSRISIELIILGSLAFIDALTTLYLLRAGLAEEANPVAKFYADKGPLWFLGLKMIPVAAMVFIELKRIMDRKRMRVMMRVGLVVYATIYFSGMLAQYSRFAQPKQGNQTLAYKVLKQGPGSADAPSDSNSTSQN